MIRLSFALSVTGTYIACTFLQGRQLRGQSVYYHCDVIQSTLYKPMCQSKNLFLLFVQLIHVVSER